MSLTTFFRSILDWFKKASNHHVVAPSNPVSASQPAVQKKVRLSAGSNLTKEQREKLLQIINQPSRRK